MKTSSCWSAASAAIVLALVLAPAPMAAAIVTGSATEVGPNITHPNGNVYDQVLLTGPSATIQADPGQIVRASFLDNTDDIVQVEFGGKGTLTISGLGSVAVPAAKYNQPGVLYVRGHATIMIVGSDATTNVGVFSVGSNTAVNLAIIRNDVTYDGIADLALIHIVTNPENPNGANFGGIFAGNAHFSSRSGDTGIYAPSVQVQNAVRVGDVTAMDAALPKLWFGENSQMGSIAIQGGDLTQPNGRSIYMHYHASIDMTTGSTSAGVILPFKTRRGKIEIPLDRLGPL